MSEQDIRWVQRLNNYNKAMLLLENALDIAEPDMLQKAGIIQFFEMSFELAWKLMKDFLEDQGFQDVKSPRAAIKKAFEVELIGNGHGWMDMLMDRNLASHTYDEQKATELEKLIHYTYFPLLKALQDSFNQRANEK